MAGVNGVGGGADSDGSSPVRRSPLERPSAARGTDSPDEVQRYLNALVSTRVFGEPPAAFEEEVRDERAVEQVEAMQRASSHADPSRHRGAGARPKSSDGLNRQMRRRRARKKAIAKVVADMEARVRKEGADPNWSPEAFPALDWNILSVTKAILADVTGRRARILAASLPPPQAEQLIRDAVRIAQERDLEEGYATLRWRELVAGAVASWRLSRPVRARGASKDPEPEPVGDALLGLLPPAVGADEEPLKPPVKRENPWKGGRVVDGYARQAFCLLMRDLRTGAPMSVSKLFYTNGSGEQGVFGYLATPKPATRGSRLPRIDGVLGLYTRFQPRADKSKYVGPPKKGPDGQPLRDKDGNVQRYALCEHWYHRDMCGRRAATQADRGDAGSRSIIGELCPWLFEVEASAEELLDEAAQDAGSVEGAESPSPAVGVETDEPAAPAGGQGPAP